MENVRNNTWFGLSNCRVELLMARLRRNDIWSLLFDLGNDEKESL